MNDRLDIAWEPITEIKGVSHVNRDGPGSRDGMELSNEDLARAGSYRRASAEVA